MPSENDKKITKKLLFATKEIDITLLDHIIIGSPEKYFSFQEVGLIDNYNYEYKKIMDSLSRE
jgi:DNA repair protein RadC